MNFDLDLYFDKKIDDKLILIFDEYFELIPDDDPILYTGKSIYGNRILGSIIEDIYDEKILRYFHILVSDINYQKLIRNQISLRELYLSSSRIYIVDFTYSMKPFKIYNLDKNSVPENWLPLEDSFIELNTNEAQLSFSSSLKGGIADHHLSKLKSTVSFIDFTTNLYGNILAPLNKSDYSIEPYYEPAMQGSFKIDLLLKIKPKSGKEFNIEFIDKVEEYFSSFIKFTFLNLKNNDSINIEDTLEFKDLEVLLNGLLNKSSKKDKTENILKKSIIKILSKSENIDDFLNNGIDNLEIKSNNTELYESQKSTVNIESNYFDKVKKYLPYFEEKIIDEICEFSVRVYEINSDTNKCKAYIQSDEKNSRLKSVRIKHNLVNFENSDYTKSLEQKTFIKIKGKTLLRNGKLILIDVIN
ncbi:MAG: hypothetical protein HYR91_04220 [Flavobacteriia bacterium]|nr:hypothetical protein [Flavobacteriia bacterium]